MRPCQGCPGKAAMGYSSQLITTYHHLATMLNAGIPVLRAFDRASETARGSLKRHLLRLHEMLGRGRTVSEAVNDCPRVFSNFDRTMIKAADDSGNLDACFAMLSEWYGFLRRMKWTVIKGMVYPLLMIHAAAFLMPLPALILGRITFMNFLASAIGFLVAYLYGPWLVIWLLAVHGKKVPGLRSFLEQFVLRIPVLGKGVREVCISRFCKAFNMLYKAGVPMSECFDLAPQASGNQAVARLFEGGRAMIAQGRMPSEGFSKRIPVEYVDLWTIGEESGDLDKCVDKIAEISADRADLKMQMFARGFPWVIYMTYIGIMVFIILQQAQGVYGSLDTSF